MIPCSEAGLRSIGVRISPEDREWWLLHAKRLKRTAADPRNWPWYAQAISGNHVSGIANMHRVHVNTVRASIRQALVRDVLYGGGWRTESVGLGNG